MRLPQFLKFEFDDNGPTLFPTAVAWTLTDGRIKYVVLMPDDDWLSDDEDERVLDDEFFLQQGVSPLDALREMNEDLAEATIYTDGLDPDEELLDVLCETMGQQPSFEVAPMSSLLRHLGSENMADRYREVMARETLDPQVAENAVYAQLLLAREEGLIQKD